MKLSVQEFDALVSQVRELFFNLRRASDLLHADFDSTAVERGVLQEIDQMGPRTVPQMAQARAISRQAMQKTIDGLLDRRWVMTQENPHHQRSSLIALTAAGTTAFEKMRRREGAVLARRDLPVTSAELRRTTETLRALSEFVATAAPTSLPRSRRTRP
jgi:DNA-binding MarR family transcriptional regulator